MINRIPAMLLALLLATGCGGSSSDKSFNIVGTWHVDSVGDSVADYPCPTNQSKTLSCLPEETWIFHADQSFARTNPTETSTWEKSGDVVTLNGGAGYALEGSGDTMTLTLMSGSHIRRKFHRTSP